jgi:hypothetical protein
LSVLRHVYHSLVFINLADMQGFYLDQKRVKHYVCCRYRNTYTKYRLPLLTHVHPIRTSIPTMTGGRSSSPFSESGALYALGLIHANKGEHRVLRREMEEGMSTRMEICRTFNVYPLVLLFSLFPILDIHPASLRHYLSLPFHTSHHIRVPYTYRRCWRLHCHLLPLRSPQE